MQKRNGFVKDTLQSRHILLEICSIQQHSASLNSVTFIYTKQQLGQKKNLKMKNLCSSLLIHQ